MIGRRSGDGGDARRLLRPGSAVEGVLASGAGSARQQVPLPPRRRRGLPARRRRAPARRPGHEVERLGDGPPRERLPAAPRRHLRRRTSSSSRRPGGLAALGAAARMVWSRSARRWPGCRRSARFRPDIVHCHNIYHQLSPSILAATRAAGVPVVMTLHDYKLACPSYQMLDHGRPCDACVGHSTLPAVRQRCKGGSLAASGAARARVGDPPAHRRLRRRRRLRQPQRVPRRASWPGPASTRTRLHVVPHFVRAEGDPAGRRVAAGRPGRRRGRVRRPALPREGCRHPRRGRRSAPEVPVHVAGDGPERPALERLAAQRRAANVIVPRAARQGRPRSASSPTSAATVVPSRWYENQPMTILESYAAAVPAVVTSLGGSPSSSRRRRRARRARRRPGRAGRGHLEAGGRPGPGSRAMGRAGQERLLTGTSPQRHLAALDAHLRRCVRPASEERRDEHRTAPGAGPGPGPLRRRKRPQRHDGHQHDPRPAPRRLRRGRAALPLEPRRRRGPPVRVRGAVLDLPGLEQPSWRRPAPADDAAAAEAVAATPARPAADAAAARSCSAAPAAPAARPSRPTPTTSGSPRCTAPSPPNRRGRSSSTPPSSRPTGLLLRGPARARRPHPPRRARPPGDRVLVAAHQGDPGHGRGDPHAADGRREVLVAVAAVEPAHRPALAAPARHPPLPLRGLRRATRAAHDEVAELAGLPADALPFVSDDEVTLAPTHSVAGNPNRHTTGTVRIRGDMEWRAAMPARDRLVVTAITALGDRPVPLPVGRPQPASRRGPVEPQGES